MRFRTLSLALTIGIVFTTGQTAASQHRVSDGNHVSVNPVDSAHRYVRALQTVAIGGLFTLIARVADDDVNRSTVDSRYLDLGGADIGDTYGNGLFLMTASVGTYGLGLITNHAYTKGTASVLIKSLVVEQAVVWGLKRAIGRTRPDSSDNFSFPSGHTAGAFTASTVLARRYGWKVGVVGYALATMTAGARLEDNKHFLSDVFAGATIGIAVGQFMTGGKPQSLRQAYMFANGSGLGIGVAF